MVVSLVGCVSDSEINENKTGIIFERFKIIDSYEGLIDGWHRTFYLTYDIDTNVEYILVIGTYGSIAISPYYDETGNVAIYEGD